MPIRIKCPKCQTILGVKESLAGKKANCPKCRFVLTIPKPKAAAAPAAPPPSMEDVEALMLSTLAEDAPQAAVPQTIEFECPFCAEMVKFSAALAGKQSPCPNPECKRIIKVPLLKSDKPKDWREVDPRAPIGGLQKGAEKPDGAWSTAQRTRVSTEALEEADAIPIKKAPVTASMWIRRGVLAGVGLLMVGAGVWFVVSRTSGGRLEGALNEALEQANTNPKLNPPAAASILCGAGEFYAMRNKADEAKDHFDRARAKLGVRDPKAKPDADRDTVLIALALSMIELGGQEPVTWEDLLKDLSRALAMVSSVEAKQTGLREVGVLLIAKGKGEFAVALASEMAQPEPAPNPTAAVVRSPLDAQHIALLYATGQAAEAAKVRPPAGAKDRDAVKEKAKSKDEVKGKDKKKVDGPTKAGDGEIDPVAQLGNAEGKALEGNFDAARQLAKHQGPALDRLEACTVVAAIAADKKKMPEAKASAQDALEALKELQTEKTPVPAWLSIQLTRACARAGLEAEAKKIANELTGNKEAQALAQLELLLPQLDNTSTAISAASLDDFGPFKDTLAFRLALEKIARHNTRLGKTAETQALLEGLDDSQKAFVHLGMALGQLDSNKK